MEAKSVEELKGERLDSIISELSESYHSPSRLRSSHEGALKLPSVASFREDYASIVRQSQELSHQIGMAILQDLWRVSSGGRWENQREVNFMCNQHGVPKVVATASLREGIDASTHRFSHRDLTQSYHFERIVDGRVLCDEHPSSQTAVVVSGSVSRIFPFLEKSPQEIVDGIVTELAERHYRGNGARNGKFTQFKNEVRTALEIIFQVGGNGGLFDTLYEGLQQVRHRAVTSPFIAMTANLENLPDSVKSIIRHENAAKTNSQNQLTWHLRNNRFFKDLEDIAASYIPSPLAVMKERVKGNESLSEKLVVARHWDAVLCGYGTGRLQEHFRRLKLPGPRKLSPTPPHLDDAVTLEVLVHDDALTYDWFNLKSKELTLNDNEKARLNKKMYRIFGQLAELEDRGYDRHKTPADRNGRQVKARMPPDRKKPHFGREGIKITRRGFVFWLDPAFGRFDDYALWSKDSGYMAIHATIGSQIEGQENGLVEVHIKPNVISNYERFSGERWEYKQERAGILHFLKSTGAVSPMEWETAKLLWAPEGRPYRETQIALRQGFK